LGGQEGIANLLRFRCDYVYSHCSTHSELKAVHTILKVFTQAC